MSTTEGGRAAALQLIYVPPLLPSCVNGHLSPEDATVDNSKEFRPDTTAYWVQDVLKSTVPGLVLGIICIVCMCVLIGWTTVAFCRCWCRTKRQRQDSSKAFDMEDPYAVNERMMKAPQVTYSDRYPTDSEGRELKSPSRRGSSSFSTRSSSQNPNHASEHMQYSTHSSFGRRHDEVNAHFGLPKDLSCVERFHVKKLLCWAIFLTSAATIGVSAWGLYVSVKKTEELVPGFWDVYGQVQDLASNVFELLSRLSAVMQDAEGSLTTLSDKKTEISALATVTLSGALGVTSGSNPLVSALDQLEPVAQVLESAKQPLQDAIAISNSTFITGLTEFRDDVEPPTLAFQNTGRFVAIGVAFGLVIFFALSSSALTVLARFPRLGATSCILLWMMTALLMFLGVGLLSGIKYVTEDGCLYAESFVVNYANQHIGGDATEYAVKAINYYVDPKASTEYIPGQALTQIVDPVAAQLLALSQQPAVQGILDQLPLVLQSQSVSGAISPETKGALEGLGSQIPVLQQLLLDIDRTASRENVRTLYESTKEYVCCSLSSDLSDLYVAWVVTGVLALVLSILVTWRLVWFVREFYPKG